MYYYVTNNKFSKKIWVLISSMKDTAKQDLERITPEVSSLVDKRNSEEKFVWSGPLNNNKTGMAVFEATHDEAKK